MGPTAGCMVIGRFHGLPPAVSPPPPPPAGIGSGAGHGRNCPTPPQYLYGPVRPGARPLKCMASAGGGGGGGGPPPDATNALRCCCCCRSCATVAMRVPCLRLPVCNSCPLGAGSSGMVCALCGCRGCRLRLHLQPQIDTGDLLFGLGMIYDALRRSADDTAECRASCGLAQRSRVTCALCSVLVSYINYTDVCRSESMGAMGSMPIDEFLNIAPSGGEILPVNQLSPCVLLPPRGISCCSVDFPAFLLFLLLSRGPSYRPVGPLAVLWALSPSRGPSSCPVGSLTLPVSAPCGPSPVVYFGVGRKRRPQLNTE